MEWSGAEWSGAGRSGEHWSGAEENRVEERSCEDSRVQEETTEERKGKQTRVGTSRRREEGDVIVRTCAKRRKTVLFFPYAHGSDRTKLGLRACRHRGFR